MADNKIHIQYSFDTLSFVNRGDVKKIYFDIIEILHKFLPNITTIKNLQTTKNDSIIKAQYATNKTYRQCLKILDNFGQFKENDIIFIGQSVGTLSYKGFFYDDTATNFNLIDIENYPSLVFYDKILLILNEATYNNLYYNFPFISLYFYMSKSNSLQVGTKPYDQKSAAPATESTQFWFNWIYFNDYKIYKYLFTKMTSSLNEKEWIIFLGGEESYNIQDDTKSQPILMEVTCTHIDSLNSVHPIKKQFLLIFGKEIDTNNNRFYFECLDPKDEVFYDISYKFQENEPSLLLFNPIQIDREVIYPMTLPNTPYIIDNLYYFTNRQNLPLGSIVSDGPNLYRIIIKNNVTILWKYHTYIYQS